MLDTSIYIVLWNRIMGVPIIEKFNSEGVVKVLYYPLAMVLRVVIMVPFFMFGVCMKDYIMKLIKANRGVWLH